MEPTHLRTMAAILKRLGGEVTITRDDLEGLADQFKIEECYDVETKEYHLRLVEFHPSEPAVYWVLPTCTGTTWPALS
jgi:hypothetical protein